MSKYDGYGWRIPYFGRPDRSRLEYNEDIRREHRYLLWISLESGRTSGHASFPLLWVARLAARYYEYRGYYTRISDRKIFPGDHGFLAKKIDGSYVHYRMTEEGRLLLWARPEPK